MAHVTLAMTHSYSETTVSRCQLSACWLALGVDAAHPILHTIIGTIRFLTRRLCSACMLVRGDLLHILLACAHPVLHAMRDQFQFPADVPMACVLGLAADTSCFLVFQQHDAYVL